MTTTGDSATLGDRPVAQQSVQLVACLRRVLPDLLAAEPVSLAYLYGSAAAGRTTPFSDVDVGLITQGDLEPRELLRMILRLGMALTDACGVSNPDVRILNGAPLVLRGRVVCEGVLLYARDDRERVEFETDTRLRYFDFLPIHQMNRDAFLAAVRERGLYG